MDGFNAYWLQHEVQKEIHAAEEDLHKLHAGTPSFHTPPEPKATKERSRRALPLAVVGAIRLFRSVVAFGSGDLDSQVSSESASQKKTPHPSLVSMFCRSKLATTC